MNNIIVNKDTITMPSLDDLCICLFATIGGLLVFSLLFLHLALGIAEAVILANNTSAKGDCGPAIWYCILLSCIIHFLLSVKTCNDLTKEDDERKNRVGDLQYASVSTSIWSVICYYGTSDECQIKFNEEHHDLWKIVQTETILFFISASIILVYCCWCCGKLCHRSQPNQQVVAVIDNQSNQNNQQVAPRISSEQNYGNIIQPEVRSTRISANLTNILRPGQTTIYMPDIEQPPPAYIPYIPPPVYVPSQPQPPPAYVPAKNNDAEWG